MLGFCDGRTKAIWGSKGTNEFDIMKKGVLSWKIEAITNAARTKNFPMVVKPPKRVI
jgi:hypothetical protein